MSQGLSFQISPYLTINNLIKFQFPKKLNCKRCQKNTLRKSKTYILRVALDHKGLFIYSFLFTKFQSPLCLPMKMHIMRIFRCQLSNFEFPLFNLFIVREVKQAPYTPYNDILAIINFFRFFFSPIYREYVVVIKELTFYFFL